MKKNTGFDVNRTFGVEIEFFTLKNAFRGEGAQEVARIISQTGINCSYEGYNHTTRSTWKIVTDGSVSGNGLELVSPPLKGIAGLNELRRVLEALNTAGAKVDKTCGIHVHHDINDYALQNFKNLYAMYARYEDSLDSLLSKSRRGSNNTYCQSPRTNLDRLAQARSIEMIIDSIYPMRYIKLNCQSYRRYGTIEFRQHQGSTEFETISNWIVLTQMMVLRAYHGTIHLQEGATDWFNFKKVIRGYGWMGADNLQQTAITFFNKRRKELAKKYSEPVAA